MDKRSFGVKVQQARIAAHLTADKLAEFCNCSTISIRQIEGGDRIPSLPKLINICNALHVTPNYLLGGEITFDLDAAADGAFDQPLKEAFLRVKKLPPKQIETVCATVSAMVDSLSH